MVVMILESVPPSVRGELTRWFLEPHAGVFVGKCSAVVRDRLWGVVRERLRGGGATLIHSADTEQGYRIEFSGKNRRSVRDFEGLLLVSS